MTARSEALARSLALHGWESFDSLTPFELGVLDKVLDDLAEHDRTTAPPPVPGVDVCQGCGASVSLLTMGHCYSCLAGFSP